MPKVVYGRPKVTSRKSGHSKFSVVRDYRLKDYCKTKKVGGVLGSTSYVRCYNTVMTQ